MWKTALTSGYKHHPLEEQIGASRDKLCLCLCVTVWNSMAGIILGVKQCWFKNLLIYFIIL